MSDQPITLARAVMRLWLPIKERKKQKALESALETIRIEAIKSEQRGFRASSVVLNIALYFLIAERDIQCFKIEALTHHDEWKRKLCARVILLTIHELDLDKVSGIALKNAFEVANVSSEARRETADALRAVRAVQQKARKEFGPIRNATIAHRDSDALAQYRAISELHIDNVLRIAAEFYASAGQFIAVLPKLMIETSTVPALLRQWVDAEHKKSPG
jgi:hypothetical protein